MSDTELLARIRVIYSEIAAFKPTFDALAEKRDALVAERTGIPNSQFRSEEEAKLYVAHLGAADAESGFGDAWERLNEMYSRLDPLAAQIRDRPAMSVADVAAKALATASMHPHLWREPAEELDYEERLLRDLLEAACALGGVDLMAIEAPGLARRLN
jgi:hypothetical protein